ncbi:MAG: two pore domain potassium channel family protein [Epsilonproteobacteria bacterium]|nr:two pore domain potassium channel family protein [Campylobacterota bacterium]
MSISRENNFWYLCLSLIGLLFAGAVTAQAAVAWVDRLFGIVAALMLIVGVRSLRGRDVWRTTVYGMAAVLGGLVWLWHVWPSRAVLLGIDGVMFLFFAGSFKLAVRQILFEGEIDGNKMVGSIALYLLIALIWTELYLMLLLFDPSAFTGLEDSAWPRLFSQVSYFSLVTLTTLGYGDVTPHGRIAEFLVAMEALVGVFYMAIFVAGLISRKGVRR